MRTASEKWISEEGYLDIVAYKGRLLFQDDFRPENLGAIGPAALNEIAKLLLEINLFTFHFFLEDMGETVRAIETGQESVEEALHRLKFQIRYDVDSLDYKAIKTQLKANGENRPVNRMDLLDYLELHPMCDSLMFRNIEDRS